MSDTSQGPGWWLASDGKWYPPEQWTGPPSTNPLGGQTAGPSEPSLTDQPTAQPGSAFPTAQPGPTGPAGFPGSSESPEQSQAYGANQWPGAAPPLPPGYGAAPYGNPAPYGQPGYAPTAGTSMNGLAIASFVCSIVGFLFITFIVGIVLGFVARSQIKNSGGRQRGDGLAIAGIIIGFAWLAFFVLTFSINATTNNTASSVITLTGAIGHIA